MAESNTMTDKKRKQIFINILIASIASSMLSTALTTALLPIANDFGINTTIGQWLTSGYALAMGIVSAFAGKIYDKLGMKKLFVSGAGFMLLSDVGMYFITMNTPIFVAAICNIIRCIAIGCLMMPLITWGTTHVKKEWVADATALLTSLRTIAGAIGSAVFVGIMTMVSNNSISTYGNNASIHGLNIAFMAMSFGTVILLSIAVFKVESHKKKISPVV